MSATIQSRSKVGSHRRRRVGMPKSSSAARTVPPPPSFHRSGPYGCASAVVEAAVVFTVRVLVAVPPDLNATLVGFRPHVGRLCAPAGELVRAQVRLSVPEYPLPAVIVADAVALDPGETGDGAGTEIET